MPATTTLQIEPQPQVQVQTQTQTAAQQSWFVYLVQTGKGMLYTGISTDPERRLRQHQGELIGGAKALRGKGPLTLVWQQLAPNRSLASSLEYQLKQLKKADKKRLIAGALLTELLPQPERAALQDTGLQDKGLQDPGLQGATLQGAALQDTDEQDAVLQAPLYKALL